MEKKLKFSLFDLLLTQTDNKSEALVEEVVKVNVPISDKIYGDGTHFESLYYKESNESTKELFYELLSKELSGKAVPYFINDCIKLKSVFVELILDTSYYIDLRNTFIVCAKIRNNDSKFGNRFYKPSYVGSSVWGMVVDMYEAINSTRYKGVYWCCSIDRTIHKDSILISGSCTENTIEIYLNNSQWPTYKTFECDELIGW